MLRAQAEGIMGIERAPLQRIQGTARMTLSSIPKEPAMCKTSPIPTLQRLFCLRFHSTNCPGLTRQYPAPKLELKRGRDAAHRTRSLPTHPTHACIEDFCGSSSALGARSRQNYLTSPAIQPFPERAPSALGRP